LKKLDNRPAISSVSVKRRCQPRGWREGWDTEKKVEVLQGKSYRRTKHQTNARLEYAILATRRRRGKHIRRDTIRQGIKGVQLDCRIKEDIRLVKINVGSHHKLNTEQANATVLNQKRAKAAVVGKNATIVKLQTGIGTGIRVSGTRGGFDAAVELRGSKLGRPERAGA
jgi:hypothetical protein